MSDDLSVRLTEAAKHFSAQSYDASSKAIAACPQQDTDPKLRANAAVVEFAKFGFAQPLSTISSMRSLIHQKSSSSSSAAAAAAPSSTTTSAISVDSASWEFSGQDVMHYNEAILRAYMGEVDTAYSLLSQLLAAKAPVLLKVRIRAGAAAFVLRRSLLARGTGSTAAASTSAATAAAGGGGASSAASGGMATRNLSSAASFSAPGSATAAASEVTEKTLSELITSPSFNAELTAAEQKELQSVVSAATASELPALQAWLKDYCGGAAAAAGGKGSLLPADVAIALNNAGVQALYSGESASAVHILAQAEAAAAAAGKDMCPMQATTVRFNLGLANFAAGSLFAAAGIFASLQRAMADSAIFWCRLGQVLAGLATEQAVLAADHRLGGLFKARAVALHQHGERPVEAAVVAPLQLESVLQDTAAANKGTGSSSAAQLFELADASLHNAFVIVMGPAAASAVLSSNNNNYLDLGTVVAAAPVGQQELIQVLYLHLVYVALHRGNPQTAARFVSHYFSVRCAAWSNNRDATATMLCYAVEAHCTVQRAPAALKLLQTHDLGELILSNNSEAGAGSASGNAAAGGAANQAAAGLLDQGLTDAMLINVCVAQLASGNWQKALALGASLLPRLQQRSPNAVLLAAYLELVRGNRDKALELFEKSPLREPL